MSLLVQGTSNLNDIDLGQVDIQTALLAVQGQRTNLLDQQLQGQIQEIKIRNDKISTLNDLMASLNKAKAWFPSDGSPDRELKSLPGWYEPPKPWETGMSGNLLTPKLSARASSLVIEVNDLIKASGLTELGFSSDAVGQSSSGEVKGAFSEITAKYKLDQVIAKVKGQIDSMGNVQQMAMLRLQSLTNKRNDAYDVMTNFIKKMHDSNSSIIGNMR